MTATKVESERAKAERHYAQVLDLITDTFDKIPLWILERFADASIELAIAAESQHLHSIVHIAQSTLTQRMEEGEVLSHDVIKGVVEHVDGQGQCFIDARNILNGVTECAKVSRNILINDVISNRQQYFGWEKGNTMLKTEYDFDMLTCPNVSDSVSRYVEGELQSGILELLYAAKTDRRHLLLYLQSGMSHGLQSLL